jgi:hypothetical protein
MTREETAKLLIVLSAAFTNFKLGEATLDVYHAVLESLSADAARDALQRVLKQPREFAPPPGVIYADAKEFMRQSAQRVGTMHQIEEKPMDREEAKRILSNLSNKIRQQTAKFKEDA